jgi:hypothetical protein
LTPATNILFLACVFFGLLLYFFGLTGFVDSFSESKAQFYLRKIAYWGAYWSLIAFSASGIIAFILMIDEQLRRRKGSE